MRSARNYGFALWIGAIATWGGAVSAAPRVEVVDPEIEFGVVAPGEPVKARFELRNTGDETLEILKANPGCACTLAEHPKTIAPGAVGYIVASLETSKLRGEVGKGIVVDTNDPENAQIVLTIKGMVMSSAMLLPEDKVYLDNLNTDGVIERRLVRANPLDKGVLEIRGIETSAAWLAVTARKLDEALPEEMGLPPSREGDWLLEVRVRGGEMPYGARSEKVTFDTGLVRQPKLEVPIYARLLPPVNLPSQKLVLAGDDPAKAHETLLLSVRHGLAPEDLKVEAEPAALRVELEPAGGRNYKAHVSWAGTRRENGTIRFRIGAETYPVSVEWGEATATTR